MPAAEMLMVFCYDVADDRRRRRLAAVLEDRCVRVQKSVFEAIMGERAADRLAERAAQHLAPGDSLRVYAISAHARPRCRTWGAAPLPEAEGYYLL